MARDEHDPEELDRELSRYSSGPQSGDYVPKRKPPIKRKPSRFDKGLLESFETGKYWWEDVPTRLVKEVRHEIIRAARGLTGPMGERLGAQTQTGLLPKDHGPEPMTRAYFRGKLRGAKEWTRRSE